jgi:hypothetical protein
MYGIFKIPFHILQTLAVWAPDKGRNPSTWPPLPDILEKIRIQERMNYTKY